MTTIPVPARVILPFINRTVPVRTKLAQHGLLELPLPAELGIQASLLLCGENILLPAAGHPRHRYGCCAYVVADNGRKALPVIGCRAWFEAPLPTHPVWADISGGLVEAARRINDAMFDLNVAIVAARSWMSRRHAEVSAHTGSALLMDSHTHVLCPGQPNDLPPRAAPAVIMEPWVMRTQPQRMAA